MPKRTFQPNRRHRAKTHGFLSRMKTKAGAAVLSRRRAKGRHKIAAMAGVFQQNRRRTEISASQPQEKYSKAGASLILQARSAKVRRAMIAAIFRLRKHADYQRVYASSRKQFSKQMSYFFLMRPALGPDGCAIRGANADGARVGLTVGKAMGKAVDRNRIKRRMREAVRRQIGLVRAPVDVVLHPRRSVMELEFVALEREVGTVFRAIQKAAEKQDPRPDADSCR